MTIIDNAAEPDGPAYPPGRAGRSAGRAPFAGARNLAARWPPPGATGDAGALLRQVLDALGFGLLLVDGHCGVVHANAVARRLCQGSAVLRQQQGRLACEGSDGMRLAAAVRTAAAGQWGMLVLPQGAARLTVALVPLQGDEAEPEVAALLVLGREPHPSPLALHFFAQAHQLTSTEKKVLESLVCGLSPRQIAAESKVAISTVRTQIAAVRAKVRATSIRDLLRQVAALPPLQGAASGTLS